MEILSPSGFVSVTLTIAWELVNGDDGGGPPVGLYGKVASKTEDIVAYVSYIYLHGHIYYKL